MFSVGKYPKHVLINLRSGQRANTELSSLLHFLELEQTYSIKMLKSRLIEHFTSNMINE